MEFPKTLQEFQAAFRDEESCWTTLRNVRWPQGFICPRCEARESFRISIRTRRPGRCFTSCAPPGVLALEISSRGSSRPKRPLA